LIYILPLTVCVYLPSNFSDWRRKTFLFLKEGRFRRSRSSKVDEFGANRKRVCDFLLVPNSNLSPILHRFGDMTGFMCSWPHPYSTLILGVFPLHQIAHVGRQRTHGPLFGREIIFEEFQPIWSRYLNVTDGRTDGQTTCNLITALWKSDSVNRYVFTWGTFLSNFIPIRFQTTEH